MAGTINRKKLGLSPKCILAVRTLLRLTQYKAIRETSKWYIPVRTNIENSCGSTYWYVLVCTALYLHITRWYKVVQDGTRWYKMVQIPVRTNIENSCGSTYWYVLVCTALYLHITRWYKVVQDGTRWYKMVQTTVTSIWRY